ncbi:hypothetical protein OG883_08605 [Streptomyces sp. NBC_01142]|uniref:hypothetical protein n=1 Tax=Streptomyces sp. NBC_01142 TaxID=2975865 RepID=UPI00224D5E58|nr:hypothetical protein [Streptomyces sp. NBC_01142]MCX4819963.1 hypothetical protein [Streptomyces sp. NBC_01142]
MHQGKTTFVVKLADQPASEPDEVWILTLDEFQMPAEEVIKELQSLTWLPGAEYPLMSNISTRQGITNWGASSSFSEFILQMGAGGLGGVQAAAVTTGVSALYGKFRDRSRGDHWGDVISEETALAVAKTHIASQYGVAANSLTLLRSETDAANKSFEFAFNHPDGRSFGAEVGVIKDSPTCMRIWRQAASE